jgi:integrase
MATVFWHGKQWIAQWYRTDGTRKKRGTKETKRREAERIAADYESKDRKAKTDHGRKYEEILSRVSSDARTGRLSLDRASEFLDEMRRVSDPDFRILTLSEVLTTWCEEKTHRVSASTAGGYYDMMRHFTQYLSPAVMKASVADLTRTQIENAMRKMKGAGLRGSTVNLDLRALRRVLAQAQEDGTIPKNPATAIKPFPQDDSKERAPFDTAEVRAMLDHPLTIPEWRGMILFGAHTGLRLGDVASLTAAHLEETDIVIRPTKTKRSRKLIRIPLTPPLLAYVSGKKGEFFPELSGKSAPTLSTQFRAIMKRSGVPALITLPGGIEASRSYHSLRHSFVSWLAAADIHADVRQKLSGHSTASSHAIYTHHDAALKRAIDTLPDLGFNSSAS